jgi:hypothetical protein
MFMSGYPNHNLTVKVQPADVGGSVHIAYDGSSVVTNSITLSLMYSLNVVATAAANSGYVFDHWDCAGESLPDPTAAQVTVVMTTDITLTAVFTSTTPPPPPGGGDQTALVATGIVTVLLLALGIGYAVYRAIT